MRLRFLAGVLGAVALVAAVAYYAGFVYYSGELASLEGRQFVSAELGLSFRFPGAYTLTQLSAPGAETLMLIRREDVVAPEAGEGPTAITIALYDNPGGIRADTWAREDARSNFALSRDGTLSPQRLAGKDGVSFGWSGLYEGKTVAVSAPPRLYAFSVTWMTAEDAILRDFDALLASVRLENE